MTKPAPQPKRSQRLSNGLNAAFVRQVKAPGRYGDGAGLYLIVDPSGASRWVLRVQVNGRRRDVGLGGTASVGLAEARDKAFEIRRLAKSGEDPVAVRRAQRDGIATFETCAKAVHKSRMATWKNGKHRAQWLKTLETHAFPTIGKTAVNRIGTAEVLKVLLPIWTTKPETARRVLQRVRTVIDYATAAGFRSGENPTRLAVLGLPKRKDEPKHFVALPYGKVPAFVASLRASTTLAPITRLAFEFLILTVARTIEVRFGLKDEIDTTAALWSIAGDNEETGRGMKSGRDHVVPLTQRCLEIVGEAAKLSGDSPLLFPDPETGEAMSENRFLNARTSLGYGNDDVTPHGFRSSFRDWVSEETSFPGEVAEMALAHVIKDKTEAAYRRGKLLEKRRQLMVAWADFLNLAGH